MPRIQWSGLPPALRDHLFDRLCERKITAEDLYELKAWRESNPDAPDGPWYKDFGSFKICGEGKYPKTSRTSANRIIVELIESGIEARQQEKKRFIELADRLARSRDVEEQTRLKEELAVLTFGE